MDKFIKTSFLIFAAILLLGFCLPAFAQSVPQVQTNSASNIQNNSATLNASINSLGGDNSSITVWFRYGTDSNYGSQTSQQNQSSIGSFSQTISNLNPNTTYHFQIASQNRYGIVYGQDMAFTTFSNTNNQNYYFNNSNSSANATMVVTKQVINLTSGNLNWQPSVNANPGDILSFAITMQANNQDLHNVFVRDTLPPNLIYRGNMTVNASLNNSGNIASGISIGTIPANGIEIISYQVQVDPLTTAATLNNSATITSNETGSQTTSSTVVITNPTPQVAGPTSISTGQTNNPVTDSFFLPMLMIIFMSWLYFTGRIYQFADWLGEKL